MRARLSLLISFATASLALVPASAVAGSSIVVFPEPPAGVGIPMHDRATAATAAMANDPLRLHLADGTSIAVPFHPDLSETQLEAVYDVLADRLSNPATSHAARTALAAQDLAFIGQIYADAGVSHPPLAADSPATHLVGTMANAGRADGIAIPLETHVNMAHETREHISLTADRPAALTASVPCGALQGWLVEAVVGLPEPAPLATGPLGGTAAAVRVSLTAVDANGQITQLATVDAPTWTTATPDLSLAATASLPTWTADPASPGGAGATTFDVALEVSPNVLSAWDLAMTNAASVQIDVAFADTDGSFSSALNDYGTMADLGVQVFDESGSISLQSAQSLASTHFELELAQDALARRTTVVGTDADGITSFRVQATDTSGPLERQPHALDWTHWWTEEDAIAACGTPYPSLELAFAGPESVQEAAAAGVYFAHLSASGGLAALRQHALDRAAQGLAVDPIAVQSILDTHGTSTSVDYDLWMLEITDVWSD